MPVAWTCSQSATAIANAPQVAAVTSTNATPFLRASTAIGADTSGTMTCNAGK